jgi:hypothetical protein
MQNALGQTTDLTGVYLSIENKQCYSGQGKGRLLVHALDQAISHPGLRQHMARRGGVGFDLLAKLAYIDS